MNSRIGVYLLAACLPVAACECSDTKGPERSAQLATEPYTPNTGEAAPQPMPKPEGTPVTSDRLAPYVPDMLGGFAASGAPQHRTTPLPNGGEVTAVRRSYERDAAKLHVEISDSLHAPGVRQLVTSQQGQTRKAATVDFRGMQVAGQPAIVQYHGNTQTAVINMVIDGRFLANLKIAPVANADPAIAVASALPIAEIVKLAPPSPPPSTGAEPAAPNAVPEEAPPEERPAR